MKPCLEIVDREHLPAYLDSTGPQLQDCTAGRDFHSGHTPGIQHHESLAVSTAQNPRALGQRGDNVVDDLAFAPRLEIFVRDINAVTADEPDTKHNAFHVYAH